MKASYIDYHETGYLSSMMARFLQNDPVFAPFISYKPDIDGFKKLINTRKITTDRNVLVETLKSQYAKTGIQSYSTVYTNIEHHKDVNTYTITIGHQLNMFTGPL